jgi:hypothetical protein
MEGDKMTTELIEHQKLSAIVENYEQAQQEVRQAFDLLVTAKERLTALLGEYRDDLFPERISDYHLRDTAKECANLVRRNTWRYLLDQMQVWSIMSDSARSHLLRQLEDNKLPEITHENVLGTFQQFYQNADMLFQDAIKEVFSFLRAGRWNRHKTNKRFLIGSKVIITCCISTYGTNHYRDQNLRALDSVFHRLDGKAAPKYPDGLVTIINQAMRERKTEKETPYFRCNWFRNGNLHIEFKRLDLLKQLNLYGGDHAHVPGPEEGR